LMVLEHRVRLDVYKREHGLLEVAEVARQVPCSETSVRRFAAQSPATVRARPYPGEWAGSPPLLYDFDAAEAIRAHIADRERREHEARTALEELKQRENLVDTRDIASYLRVHPTMVCSHYVNRQGHLIQEDDSPVELPKLRAGRRRTSSSSPRSEARSLTRRT
jgi:hypothetical protein